MPNRTNGQSKRHWGTWRLNQMRRIERDRKSVKPEDIQFQTTLSNGATYTRLKPGVALSAETVELWRQYNL